MTCEGPINTEFVEFQKPAWKELDPHSNARRAVGTLYPRVQQFMLGRDQGSKEQDEAREAELRRHGLAPSIEPLANIEKWRQL